MTTSCSSWISGGISHDQCATKTQLGLKAASRSGVKSAREVNIVVGHPVRVLTSRARSAFHDFSDAIRIGESRFDVTTAPLRPDLFSLRAFQHRCERMRIAYSSYCTLGDPENVRDTFLQVPPSKVHPMIPATRVFKLPNCRNLALRRSLPNFMHAVYERLWHLQFAIGSLETSESPST